MSLRPQTALLIEPRSRLLFRRLWAQNVPHKTRSGSCWCWPVWWTWVFGGSFDTGNGYGWHPPMTPRRFRCCVRNRLVVWRAKFVYWRMKRACRKEFPGGIADCPDFERQRADAQAFTDKILR